MFLKIVAMKILEEYGASFLKRDGSIKLTESKYNVPKNLSDGKSGLISKIDKPNRIDSIFIRNIILALLAAADKSTFKFVNPSEKNYDIFNKPKKYRNNPAKALESLLSYKDFYFNILVKKCCDVCKAQGTESAADSLNSKIKQFRMTIKALMEMESKLENRLLVSKLMIERLEKIKDLGEIQTLAREIEQLPQQFKIKETHAKAV